MKKNKMPKTLVVYVCDYEDSNRNKPVYGVADGGIEGIPADAHGEPVGIYNLKLEGKLKVVQTVV